MNGPDAGRGQRWEQVERIYWRAVEESGPARDRVLEVECGGAADLRSEVEALLASDALSADFLESGALEVAADLLNADDDGQLIGRRVGPYVIQAWLGSGGMGDVYRATDDTLRRDVALKVLSPLTAGGGAARLAREAQVLASLNHQYIAAIYGFVAADGLEALALELVEGPTLAQLLARKRLPVDETLSIARQIAEGLEAAHERGIVHRDLKPANIVVRDDRVVKLLDFGIAAVFGSERPAGPTMGGASQAVAATVAYASPEQLRGLATDRRTDIWSFGVVLYEALAGQAAFSRASTTATIEAVLNEQVDEGALPPTTPVSVRQLLARCLTKDPRQRLQDIGEARIGLEPGNLRVLAATPRGPTGMGWARAVSLGLAAVGIAGLTAGATWHLKPATPASIARFTVALPDGQSLSLANGRRAVAVSPDGTRIVYAGIPAALYRRDLAAPEPVRISGSEGFGRVSEPAFSPDGSTIAFHAAGWIRTVPAGGGSPAALVQAEAPYGLTWGVGGIVFGQGAGGITRIGPAGKADLLVALAPGESAQGPQILPDGRHVLFTLASSDTGDRWDQARIVVQSLSSGERKTLLEGGSDARYLATGHLVYARKGTLYAVAFDPDRVTTTGTPRAVMEGVTRLTGSETGAVELSVSDSGVLAYVPAPAGANDSRSETFRLGLIDPKGAVTSLPLAADTYGFPRLSPDGAQLAVTTEEGGQPVLWTWDVSGRRPRQRLVCGGDCRDPIWSPDSRRLAFQLARGGERAIYVQPADGSRPAERLTSAPPGVAQVPQSWSPDGRVLLFTATRSASVTLAAFDLQTRQETPFAGVAPSSTISAAFSPDGKWVAYGAGERGRVEIFVQPFPQTGVVHRLDAMAHAASHPLWSRNGKALFFNPGLRGLGVVDVVTAPSFGFGAPSLLPRPFRLSPPDQPRAYDLTRSGLFLARIPVDEDSDVNLTGRRINVVINWSQELRGGLSGRR